MMEFTTHAPKAPTLISLSSYKYFPITQALFGKIATQDPLFFYFSPLNFLPFAFQSLHKLFQIQFNSTKKQIRNMRANSKRSSGPVVPVTSQFSRSISPSGRFGCGGGGGLSAFAATSPSLSSSFAPTSSQSFLTRSASPTRVNFSSATQPAPSVKFSLPFSHRPISPNRNAAAVKPARKTCMCSPTTHPGSFRCSLHKGQYNNSHHRHGHGGSAPPSSSRLNARRSAMTNSLIRISTVEGDLVKRALAALIRPSSHQQRRRGEFQPRPSRLSVMSKASD